MSHTLFINDNNLLIRDANGRVDHSAGYAWLKDDQVLFDIGREVNEAPIAHCRTAPQQVNSRYWQECAQTAISANRAGMRHAADLIWKHLAEFKRTYTLSDVQLVVPAHYRDHHLQLLLGIARSLDLKVNSLLSKPVLFAQHFARQPGRFVHLDVQLHQTLVSHVSIEQDLIQFIDVDIKPDVSIHAMQESLLKVLQSRFIQSDRFDPLHDANTEQQLFDQLSNIIATVVKTGKANVAVQHQQQMHSAAITSDDVEQALGDCYHMFDTVKATANGATLCTDLNAAFGHAVPDKLRQASDFLVQGLPDELLMPSAGVDESGGVLYQTELPLLSHAAGSAKAADLVENQSLSKQPVNAVTHLLQGGIAVPASQALIEIDQNQLRLQQSTTGNLVQQLSNQRLIIANDPGRRVLQVNDRLVSDYADGVLIAISVAQQGDQ